MSGKPRKIVVLSDEEKVQADSLYKKYHSIVYNYMKSRTLRHDKAEEYANEVFIRIMKNIEKYQGIDDDEIRKLVYTYSENVLISMENKENKAKSVPFSDLEIEYEDGETLSFEETRSSDENTEQIVLNKEIRSRLAKIISNLDPIKRQAIIMRYVYDMKTEDIASELNILPSTLRSMIQRTREELKRRLTEGHE